MKSVSMLRVLACLLAAVMLLSSCGSIKPIAADEEDLRVVMRADEYDICYDELRYYTCNLKAQMCDYYGSDIWADAETAAPYLEELYDGVIAMCRYNAAVLSLAAEFGISYTEELIQEKVQEDVDSLVEELGSKRAYRKALDEYYMTDRLFRYITAVTHCETELYHVLISLQLIDNSDEAAEAFLASDDLIRTLHIYISNDAGENIDANRERAESLREELNNGADFITLIGRHSEDFYMTTTDGYYFTRGEMNLAYEEAAFSLKENAYSDVVTTSSGFYIILRLPTEEEYIEKNFETLKNQYLSATFYNMIEERRDEINVTVADDTIELWQIN